MIEIEFSIYLASKKEWVHLLKTIRLSAVPRVGESVKFNNRLVGDYFAWTVNQVTYRENGVIEVMTDLLDNINCRMYSFEEHDEFLEYYHSYLDEGWISPRGVRVNTQYLNRKQEA
ncbi:hypothetical protein ACSTJP_01440 [Vibrio parahaemolyticus]|nr:hypothetical protein [Vibrio parahaemolyticus]